MVTLVVLDTATQEAWRYVGGGAVPVLTHRGWLSGNPEQFAMALEKFRTSPPAGLRTEAAVLPPYVA